jgi:predicted RNA methylase
MENSKLAPPGILASARQYWRDCASRKNRLSATGELLRAIFEYLRDSTPWRLRQRFGDADYDWDFRVNTTGGAVGWRDRLLGAFHSPYQPTEPGLFRDMLNDLRKCGRLNLADFTFIDLGSGKGRTLLMASSYPFRRILGVELLPALHQIAQQNLAQYKNDSQQCFAVESICGDATSFVFPDDPLIVYLFNPFPESGLRRALMNLQASRTQRSQPVYVIYHNPQLEHVITASASLQKIGGTHQYSIFGPAIQN